MNRQITILGFAGSLRKDSYNKALLNAAVSLNSNDSKLETFGLSGITPFNQDLEAQMPKGSKNSKQR
jgi:chromate reductase